MDLRTWFKIILGVSLIIAILCGIYFVPIGEQITAGTQNTILDSIGASIGGILIDVGNAIRLALVTFTLIVCLIIAGILYLKSRQGGTYY